MEIKTCIKKRDINNLILYKRNLYKGDKNFKNNDEILLKEIISKKSTFNKENYVEPIVVIENEEIVAACVIISASNYREYIQIAFLDFNKKDSDLILDNIIEYAKGKAKEFEAKKIVIGLNGHINYGLGILVDGFEHTQSFGGAYNKDYYGDAIKKFANSETFLDSFNKDLNEFDMCKYSNILKRVDSKFYYRYLNKNDLKGEAKIYNDLNNIIFSNHKYYYKRSLQSDYELLKDLSYLIEENNLIWAFKDNTPVGYVLWYPEFNELLKEKEKFSLLLILKNKLFYKKIKKLKIVEIGVLPQYKNTGVIMGLFGRVYKLIKNRYTTVESSWILEKNFKSRNFGVKFEANEYKKFAVYEINV